MGNICDRSFKEIWSSDRYWQVMNHLAGPSFNAQLRRPDGPAPPHLSFI
jgi:hypothetical protein